MSLLSKQKYGLGGAIPLCPLQWLLASPLFLLDALLLVLMIAATLAFLPAAVAQQGSSGAHELHYICSLRVLITNVVESLGNILLPPIHNTLR
jgi:hypothetical protein